MTKTFTSSGSSSIKGCGRLTDHALPSRADSCDRAVDSSASRAASITRWFPSLTRYLFAPRTPLVGRFLALLRASGGRDGLVNYPEWAVWNRPGSFLLRDLRAPGKIAQAACFKAVYILGLTS